MVSGVCPWAGGRIRAEGATAQCHCPPVSRRDRKKKRFVGQTGQEDKKKVRTESGRYISSSYKNNLYPAMGTAACLGWGLQERGWTPVSGIHPLPGQQPGEGAQSDTTAQGQVRSHQMFP